MTTKQHDIALLDPPWMYGGNVGKNFWGCVVYGEKAHYPMIPIPKIGEMDIAIKPDGIAFCWTTMPLIHIQLRMIKEQWGFKHVIPFLIWAKYYKNKAKFKLNPGAYTASNIEILFLCCNTIPKDIPESPYLLFEHCLSHSQKPTIIKNIIKDQFPWKKDRIEYFARDSNDKDWHYEGLDVERFKNKDETEIDNTLRGRQHDANHHGQKDLTQSYGHIKWPDRPQLQHINTVHFLLIDDVDIEWIDTLGLKEIANEQCFLCFRADIYNVDESIRAIERLGFLYRTALFSVIDKETGYFALYLIAKTKKAKVRNFRKRHICQVVEVQPDECMVEAVMHKLNTVFGEENQKLWITRYDDINLTNIASWDSLKC